MVSGDTHLVKDHVSGVGATDAHLVLMLAHGHAGSVPFHDEQGDAVLALGGVCGAGHGIQVGYTAVGDEGLAAGDDILIAVLDSLGLAVAGIGAGLRLGDTHSPESTFSQALTPILLLLLRAGQQHGLPAEGLCTEGVGEASVMIRHGLADVHNGGHIQTGTAVLLGNVDTPEAQVHQLPNLIHGAMALSVPLIHIGIYLFLHEIMDHSHQVLLVLGHQLEFTHLRHLIIDVILQDLNSAALEGGLALFNKRIHGLPVVLGEAADVLGLHLVLHTGVQLLIVDA